jgi:hypothetical protein
MQDIGLFETTAFAKVRMKVRNAGKSYKTETPNGTRKSDDRRFGGRRVGSFVELLENGKKLRQPFE